MNLPPDFTPGRNRIISLLRAFFGSEPYIGEQSILPPPGSSPVCMPAARRMDTGIGIKEEEIQEDTRLKYFLSPPICFKLSVGNARSG